MMEKNWFRRLFSLKPRLRVEAIAPGLYHSMRQADGTYTRFHLRVEPDGSGMLLANATAAARLSPSGVVIAKRLLEGKDDDAIVRELSARFRGVPRPLMRRDVDVVKAIVEDLAAPGDNYPIINLEDAAVSPREVRLMAPLQADVSLAEPERLVPIVDRLWQAGIPHVTFFAPENPDRAHLVRAVERAEDTGMIAGVRGRGTDLLQGTLIKDLAMAGVDHVTVLYASAEGAIHDALCGEGDHAAAMQVIAAAHENEVCPVAEVALVTTTIGALDETLRALADMNVTNASFFAIAAPDGTEPSGALSASGMPETAALVEHAADATQVRYIWQPPVMRNPAETLGAQVRAGPRCSGDVSIRVEPDGSVIPPRGPYQSAGNLLTDSWEAIWNHPAFQRYRGRVEAPTRCDVCPGLAICAADCPREPEGWSHPERNEVQSKDAPGGER